jgi:predicted RNA-binding Zn-ribbon protein involved in translation (DUF1610 family)
MKGLGNLRDVFRTIKHKKPTAIFCPKCGSPEIRLSSSLDYWLTPRKYYCPKCGYTGILVMELEPDENSQETQEAQMEAALKELQNQNNEEAEEEQNRTATET